MTALYRILPDRTKTVQQDLLPGYLAGDILRTFSPILFELWATFDLIAVQFSVSNRLTKNFRYFCCLLGPVYTPMISHIPFLCEGLTQVQFPKRLGNVEEFAHLVQSIIENTSINATTIRLDGGYRHYTGNESQIPKQK